MFKISTSFLSSFDNLYISFSLKGVQLLLTAFSSHLSLSSFVSLEFFLTGELRIELIKCFVQILYIYFFIYLSRSLDVLDRWDTVGVCIYGYLTLSVLT